MSRSTTPSLIWSLTARADLIRLRDFIELHNPEGAKNAAQSLTKAANLIIQHPGIGTRRKDRHDRELFVPFGKRGSVIRYRIDADAIVILKIGHSLEE
ncbi:MAG: type II toxin-antitoxin system RelE/ParE family toxin [Methylomicrobium sp.]|nr:type II toxin-antitoxin system RelE/ParE family toxin [Methylomicrobium sp.]